MAFFAYYYCFKIKSDSYKAYEKDLDLIGTLDNSIFGEYYNANGCFPLNASDLLNFIDDKMNNDELNSGKWLWLSQNPFHILLRNDTLFVYDNGFDFSNDSLTGDIDEKNVTWMNYLTKKHDMLLFYYPLVNPRIDPSVPPPPPIGFNNHVTRKIPICD